MAAYLKKQWLISLFIFKFFKFSCYEETVFTLTVSSMLCIIPGYIFSYDVCCLSLDILPHTMFAAHPWFEVGNS